eukprot:COSAG01_NODE_5477_length_4236_cov_2.696157_2_plen_150_part_00
MYQDKSLRDKLRDKLRVVSSSPSHCMLVPARHTLVIPRGERLRWAWASLLAALACCSASIARKAALDGSMGKERDAVEPARRTRQSDIIRTRRPVHARSKSGSQLWGVAFVITHQWMLEWHRYILDEEWLALGHRDFLGRARSVQVAGR